MNMRFTFDVRKTIAAIAYLMEREGGQVDMFLALKTLYLADKEALTRWGNTITGDDFVSLDKGPVLSKTYNLFKAQGTPLDRQKWEESFTERVNHSIQPLKALSTDLLSEREMDVLEESRRTINNFAPWQIADWLHNTCPEWTDPHGSMIPIDPVVILQNSGRSEEEIQRMQASNLHHDQARAMLGLR